VSLQVLFYNRLSPTKSDTRRAVAAGYIAGARRSRVTGARNVERVRAGRSTINTPEVEDIHAGIVEQSILINIQYSIWYFNSDNTTIQVIMLICLSL